MDAVFKALADPTRRTLLDRLYTENGQSLTQLCQALEMSRQAVTQHLAVLEQAQLVVIMWRGREKLHYLNPAPIHEMYERWISKYERHRLQALSDLKRHLEGEASTTSAKIAPATPTEPLSSSEPSPNKEESPHAQS